MLWNINNGFITLSHTADNAKWGRCTAKPGTKASRFFGAQFAVFGPILFGVFLLLIFQFRRTTKVPADRLLMIFSLPILTLILTQAFLSRAHANWAATTYVAATILVVGFPSQAEYGALVSRFLRSSCVYSRQRLA